MEIESKNPIFIIGDHIGLPKSDEKFIKRFNAKKISLGKKRYFAKDVIAVLNYMCDRS
jgi:tRNA pseudouridine-54 N-methylase